MRHNLIVSISDIQNFQRCKRKWNYQSPNQRSLVKAGMPRAPFLFGDMIHKHIDIHLDMLPGNVSTTQVSVKVGQWLLEKIKEYETEYVKIVGCSLSTQETDLFFEAAKKAFSVYKNYVDYYGNDLFEGFECIGIEQPFEIPIPGSPGDYYVGKLDKVFVKGDDLYLADHKSYSKKKGAEALHPNMQFRSYSWVASQIFPQTFKGFIYDGILKQEPVVPATLKNGQLSKAKNQWTTSQLYLEEVARLDLDLGSYKKIIKHFEGRQADYFNRVTLPYSEGYLEEVPKILASVIAHMKFEVTAPKSLRYMPNVPFLGCIDCDFKKACYLQSNGLDYEKHLKNTYVSKVYDTFKEISKERLGV